MPRPTVSIILPTFNRSRFMPDAFASICAQTYTDWELIVVDDGSTDDTEHAVGQLAADIPRFRYVRQSNQGAYGARNTGLKVATGDWIAFFDSDDLWLPYHLEKCMEVLDASPTVDWVFGACRIIDQPTGRELAAHTFYVGGTPRPFLTLRQTTVGDLHIIDDPHAVSCALLHGFYCGLQNSVIRRRLFDDLRFDTSHRNEAEDRLIVIRALVHGYVFAYLNEVLVTYRVHDANSSAAGAGQSLETRKRVLRAVLDGYEDLPRQVPLNAGQRRALNRRLGQEYFWHLGYSVLWQNGQQQEAIEVFRRGLIRWPWNLRCWKTYLLAQMRYSVSTLRTPQTQR